MSRRFLVARATAFPSPGLAGSLALAVALASSAAAQVAPRLLGSHVVSERKLTGASAGVAGPVRSFAGSVVSLGDLDDDGIGDVAVGNPEESAATRPFVTAQHGAVRVLFLAADGSVKAEQVIGYQAGGFPDVLGDCARLGQSLAAVGDLDGDGNTELAVGAPHHVLEAHDGRVYVLFLDDDGTVKSSVRIGENEGGLTTTFQDFVQFGRSLAPLGDVDENGVPDLAVGETNNLQAGSIYVLRLKANGTVERFWRISKGVGGFSGDVSESFGSAVAGVGDVDGDGIPDVVVGDPRDTDPAGVPGPGCLFYPEGSLWTLFLNPNGTVREARRIAGGELAVCGATGAFVTVGCGSSFSPMIGGALAGLGDLDGNGVRDLAVGYGADDAGCVLDPGCHRGGVLLAMLRSDGGVLLRRRIDSLAGNLQGPLADDDLFGAAVASFGDFDGDGFEDLLVGTREGSSLAANTGALVQLELGPPPASARAGRPAPAGAVGAAAWLEREGVGEGWALVVDGAPGPGQVGLFLVREPATSAVGLRETGALLATGEHAGGRLRVALGAGLPRVEGYLQAVLVGRSGPPLVAEAVALDWRRR